jgi:serine/threonine-protein kinase
MNLAGRYEILGVLGEGGAGIVYDALRIDGEKRVALKVLHGHLQGDRQFRGRFEREAQILRRLEGPHVCPVLDSGEMPDPRDATRTLLYMALPRIDGPSLESELKAGALPSARAIDLTLQVLDALAMAHAQGFVHRDLKPANVLLERGSHVVVVDFGLAKILTGDTTSTVLTAHNMVCGTPEYMAPEQARGEEVDARCDIYATGVMLYQMLTGEAPFTGPTPLSVLTAHLTSTPVPPRERAPEKDISPAIEAVVLHAIAKVPGDRYSTATEMSAALLHARAMPGVPDKVHPEAFRVRLDVDADGHAETMHDLSSRPAPPRAETKRPAEASETGLGPAGWRVVWLVAAAASIGAGIWLSLRAP